MSSAAPDFRLQSRQPERNHNTSLTSPEWPLFAHCGRILPYWHAQASQQRAPKSVRQRESRSLKEEPLETYWAEPEEDRDWDVMLLTRFLDALIEIGQTRAAKIPYDAAGGGCCRRPA